MILERIKDLANERGLTIKEVATKLGFGENAFYKWDKQSPRTESLNRVADYFGVSIDYLMGKTNIRNLELETKKYEQFQKLNNEDVADVLNFVMDQLGAENYALMFDGEELDEETRDLLKDSLENSFRMAKVIRAARKKKD